MRVGRNVATHAHVRDGDRKAHRLETTWLPVYDVPATIAPCSTRWACRARKAAIPLGPATCWSWAGDDIPVARLDDESMNPLFLETSRPGIFAVGDVRSGSVERTVAAIGEGSMAVRLVFDRLQSAGTTDAISSSAPAHPAL